MKKLSSFFKSTEQTSTPSDDGVEMISIQGATNDENSFDKMKDLRQKLSIQASVITDEQIDDARNRGITKLLAGWINKQQGLLITSGGPGKGSPRQVLQVAEAGTTMPRKTSSYQGGFLYPRVSGVTMFTYAICAFCFLAVNLPGERLDVMPRHLCKCPKSAGKAFYNNIQGKSESDGRPNVGTWDFGKRLKYHCIFTRWVINGMRPLTIGQDAELRELLLTLTGGGYSPPKYRTVMILVLIFYDLTIENIKKHLAEVCAFYGTVPFLSLGFDGWTNRMNVGFLGIMLNFIWDFKVVSICVGLIHLHGRHRAQDLAAEIAVILLMYGLVPKSYGEFTDESQMTLSKKFDFSNLIRHAICDRGGGVPNAAIWLCLAYLPCLLHVFDTIQKWSLVQVNGANGKMSTTYGELPQWVIDNALGRIREIVKKSRSVAGILNKSSQMSGNVKLLQEGLTLFVDNPVKRSSCTSIAKEGQTRCWSLYTLFKSLLASIMFVNDQLDEAGRYNDKFIEDDILDLRFLVGLLGQVVEVQKWFESKKIVTISGVLVLIEQLLKFLKRSQYHVPVVGDSSKFEKIDVSKFSHAGSGLRFNLAHFSGKQLSLWRESKTARMAAVADRRALTKVKNFWTPEEWDSTLEILISEVQCLHLIDSKAELIKIQEKNAEILAAQGAGLAKQRRLKRIQELDAAREALAAAETDDEHDERAASVPSENATGPSSLEEINFKNAFCDDDTSDSSSDDGKEEKISEEQADNTGHVLIAEFDAEEHAKQKAKAEVDDWILHGLSGDILSGTCSYYEVEEDKGRTVAYNKSVHSHMKDKRQKVVKEFDVLVDLKEMSERKRTCMVGDTQKMVPVYTYLILVFLSILGTPSHAANPERFFRLCGLIACALRAAMGARTLIMLAFLKYNIDFWPKDSEVIAEYYIRREKKRVEKASARRQEKRKHEAADGDEGACDTGASDGVAMEGSSAAPIPVNEEAGVSGIHDSSDSVETEDLPSEQLKKSLSAVHDSHHFDEDLNRHSILDFELDESMVAELLEASNGKVLVPDEIFEEVDTEGLASDLMSFDSER